MTHPVMPGAEPMSVAGTNGCGAIVLHGFTGNPHSMRGLANAFAAAGFAVEMPLLPGHGTAVEDMLPTRFADWSGHVEATYQRLAPTVEKVVVAGLSMGGTLTAWLAIRHPEIAGIVTINGALEPLNAEFRGLLQGMVDSGEVVFPGIGSDIADPDSKETAYPETPLAALLSLAAAGDELDALVASITCPALVMTSPQDHVVVPTAGPYFASRVSGPVETLSLERSYHVATLDYDKDLINAASIAFATKVCGLS